MPEPTQSNGQSMSLLLTKLINTVIYLVKKPIIEEHIATVYRLNLHFHLYQIEFADSSAILKVNSLQDVKFVLEVENNIREAALMAKLRSK